MSARRSRFTALGRALRRRPIDEPDPWYQRAVRAGTADAILLLDQGGTVLDAAPRSSDLVADVSGQPWSGLWLWPDAGAQAQTLFETVAATAGAVAVGELPVRLGHRPGWVTARLVNLLHEEDAAVLVVLRCVTEQRGVIETLRHQAFHDPLTGLVNRVLFEDRLDHALRHRAHTQHPPAVLYVDLDRFKAVNDEFGHAAGDEVLREVAGRLSQSVRPQDTVARLGGDEFAVLLDATTDSEDAEAVAGRILGSLREPMPVGDRRTTVSASIGISVAHRTAGRSDLVSRADAAMYVAKASGGARWSAGPEDEPAGGAAGPTGAELVEALAAGEVHLLHQPVVEMASGRVVGAEALLRWNHPDAGSIDPLVILAVARSAGVLRHLTAWTLSTAASHAAAWHRQGCPGYVSVNVAPEQIDDWLALEIDRTLRTVGLHASALVIEVSGASAHAVDRLQAVQRLGVRVAIDDVGIEGVDVADATGPLRADLVKIPPAVLAQVGSTGPLPDGLLRSARLARALAIDVVAVGVARSEQRDRIVGLCSHVQGHLCGIPVPSGSLVGLLRRLQPGATGRRRVGGPTSSS